MKQKLKKILLLYLFTGTLFVSCTMEEEAIRKHNYSKDIKIYQKSFDELMKDSKFSTSFNKLPKKKSVLNSSSQARTVMEEQYGFTITNTPARVMQVGSITSYTFHIERENNNPSFFENLVVQNDSVGNTTAHIIKYTPFMPMTAFPEHNSYSFEGETEFTSIIYDDTQVNTTGRMVTVCRNLYRTMCNGRIGGLGGDCTASTHVYNTACETTPNCIFQQFLTETCTTYDDGETIGGTGGGTGGGGTGTGGGGSTDPVYSDPVPDNNYITSADAPFTTPCEQLKTLLNDTNKQAIEYLETKANDSKEWGYSFKTFPNSTNLAPPSVIQADEREPNKIKMSACTGGDYVGAFHTHPIPSAQGVVPMFSPGDFKWLRDVARNHTIPNSGVKNYNTYFLTLTVQSGTYAIKIKDWAKFSIFYGTKYEEFQEKLKDTYIEMNGSERNENELMIALLKELTNSGVGLYELNDEKNNWLEVTLNPLSNVTPQKKPCN